jgi:hypothetical protein
MVNYKDIYRRDSVVDKETADKVIKELSKDKNTAKMLASMDNNYNEKEMEKSWDDHLQDHHEEVFKYNAVDTPKHIIREREIKRLKQIGDILNEVPTPLKGESIIELDKDVTMLKDIVLDEKYSTDTGKLHKTNNKELNIGNRVLFKNKKYTFNVDNKRYVIVKDENILGVF